MLHFFTFLSSSFWIDSCGRQGENSKKLLLLAAQLAAAPGTC